MNLNKSRLGNSIRNSLFALAEQIAFSVLSFICRTVFIYILGKTYLGFSSLFSDIFTLLSLAELGAGTAIIYSMYKPVAEHDYRKVAALLNLYKKFYNLLGIIITIVGLLIVPFLDFFISDLPDMPELPVIYILYLLNTTASYFFIYKKSILITNQRNYIASLIYIVVITVQNILQIVFLVLTKNFIIYLIIMLVGTVVNNACVSVYVDKHYKYLKEYRKERIDAESKKVIFKNVGAMFLSKISSAVVTSTDNILISKFVSTITLGLYSNYTLFTTILRTVFTKIFEGLTGSVGNLIATESSEDVYSIFKKIWFVNFWLVAFCSITLFILINPFITLWIGESYLLDFGIVFLVCTNFYIRFIRNTFIMFTDTYGLFNEFKIKCVCEAGINFVVSIYFVKHLQLGIIGVLLGTVVSNVLTNFWYEPYVIFVKKFQKSWMAYFTLYTKYLISAFLAGGITFYFCKMIGNIGGWGAFLLELLCCCIVINVIFTILYGKTDEFQYFKNMVIKKFNLRIIKSS